MDEGERAARAQALELLEQRNYRDALNLLKQRLTPETDGEGRALLGLAHYHLEEYASAVEHYSAALQYDAGNQDWQDMLGIATANTIAEIQVPVPDVYFFDRDKLLAQPIVPKGTLPPRPPRLRSPGPLKRLRVFVETSLGAIVGFATDILIQLVGKFLGYRGKVWTNWYRRWYLIGTFTLAYLRVVLTNNNLKNTYPKGTLVGFQTPGQSPPEGVSHFRTADGSWNNLSDPKEGAAGTRFSRNVSNDAIHPETGDTLMTPNPRQVSLQFLTREGGMKEIPFLNLLAAAWINFENHDWIDHGQTLINEHHEIPLAADDPARAKFRQTKMVLPKSQPDPTRVPEQEETPISFINEVTHWWDGSQIYGSDQETVDRLRSGVDGKLRINTDGTLPIGQNGVEETGFTRNWWIGLTLLHTLFAREHNAICDHLKQTHPGWDDNRLFNVARLINAALIAKIHSIEWTPAILPNRALDAGLNANWFGLWTNVLRVGNERKTLSEFNVRNPEMGGLVGNRLDKHGQPFSFAEEFVEVYRLHSLLPETISLRRIDDQEQIEEIPFLETRQAGSPKLTERMGLADLFYSFGRQHPGQLVLNNFPKFMQELSVPGNPLFDMGAVDILRARERGVPRYNEFRRQLALNPIRTFEDLTNDKKVVERLKEVYGDKPEDVEKLDLMIGTLGEETRPTGFGFGETLFQIFILNASRRLEADRFYTEDYNEETYTKEGLKWIDDSSLKSVLLRHYPELANSGLANVKNAFEPWDPDERLDKNRHPLREYDRELRPDPWLGDLARASEGGHESA